MTVLDVFRDIIYALDSIDSRLFDIEKGLRSLNRVETREMATLKQVQDDIEEMRVEAARNADQANAASEVIRRMLTMIGEAAASATDLDALKASLDEITSTVGDSADTLGTAIAEVPGA